MSQHHPLWHLTAVLQALQDAGHAVEVVEYLKTPLRTSSRG